MIDRIVVINDLAEPMGGASQLALHSARAFVKCGYAVTFISGDCGNEADDGIDYVSLGQSRLLSSNSAKAAVSGIWNSPAKQMVGNWIGTHDTTGTVYHVHGWTQILSPSLFSALGPVMDRVVVSAHDFFSSCPNGAMFDFRRGESCTLRPLSFGCMARNCDRRRRLHKAWRTVRHSMLGENLRGSEGPAHLLIHAGMAPLLEQGGLARSRMAALPNPVSAWSSDRIAAERNSDVLFVGRIEGTKGVNFAAEACRIAGQTLLAIGGGADLDGLQRQFPEMKFRGRVAPAQVGFEAKSARMLIMPSLYNEPFGLTALEAAWSGIPVIISRHALIAKDLVDVGAGIAVDPANPDDIAKAIERIASDDDLARSMSENAFARTRKLALDFDIWIDELLSGYDALLTGGADKLVETVSARQPTSASVI